MFTPVLRFTLLLLASVALFAACGEDDNPIVDNGDDDEPLHADADGFVLKVDGNEIYRQFEGTHSGSITLKVGDELDVLTMFLDHDSNEFLPQVSEEEEDHGHEENGEDEVFALALSGYDSSIIEIHLYDGEGEAHDDDHDEDDDHDDDDDHGDDDEHDEYGDELAEKFTFEVTGLKAGQTEIKLQLMHGDHPDFTAARLIPVTVTP